jgi:hypothetical protein
VNDIIDAEGIEGLTVAEAAIVDDAEILTDGREESPETTLADWSSP